MREIQNIFRYFDELLIYCCGLSIPFTYIELTGRITVKFIYDGSGSRRVKETCYTPSEIIDLNQ